MAIARAIVTDPKVLVADEPTGDLDAKSAEEILDLLETLNREFKKTIVMVTHDPRAAERAHTQRHLDKGVLRSRGGTDVMKFLPYVLKHLRRNWIRTRQHRAGHGASASSCSARCRPSLLAVNFGARRARSAARLVTRHAVSLVFNLPAVLRGAGSPAIPGVSASPDWFGGSLPPRGGKAPGGPRPRRPDFSNFFANFAVDAEPYLDDVPRVSVLTPEERQAFLQDLRGCIIGRGPGRRVRLEGGRHVLPRELHPALPDAASPSSSW